MTPDPSDPIDPGTLMAYADDALPPTEAARVAAYLARNEQARAQVAQWRASAALARQAFDADLNTPVPDALRLSVERAIAQARAARRVADTAPPAAARPAPARPARQGLLRWLGFDLQPGFALAAGAATLVAGLLGYFVGSAAPDAAGGGVLIASRAELAELARALDSAPSGARRTLATGGQLELVASFRAQGDALCREFTLARGEGGQYLAVACRGAQQWTVDFAAAVPATGASYAPAASSAAAADAFIASIGGGAPLSPADEARALSGR
jgi:anti-sigma factor RsiW